ncbi:MAG: DUF47 family protein [Prevotellaceae bacterium]|jgi:predicted phosphate transport protein (TIGR00153 family)|nr:DUF47 family protein [Prevotellaceae bacterium]
MDNSFFNRLLPKEKKFFPLLKKISDVLIATSEIMIDCVQCENHQSVVEYYKKIKEKEHEGDFLSNKVFDELNKTFITPFDREDIHDLANKLDDVVDGINSCAKRIMLYNPKKLPEDASKLAKLINKSAISIGKAIAELDVLKKKPAMIKEYCRELHDIEHEADDVYENFIINLFENEKDGIEIIKLKEIVSELEKITDIEEHVGKIIQTIIVKYS